MKKITDFFKGKAFKRTLVLVVVLIVAILIVFGFRSCNMGKKKNTEKPKVVQVDNKQKQIDSLKNALIVSQEQLADCQKNCNKKAPAKITKKPIRKKTKKNVPKVEVQVPVVVEVVKVPENVELKLNPTSTLEKKVNVTEKQKKPVTKIVPKKIETKKVETEDDCPTCPRRYGTIEFHY